MGLKIRGGKHLAGVFFGFAEHKTFVEYFGVTEFAKPQTKTHSGLLISICPGMIQEGRHVRGKLGGHSHPQRSL